LTYTLLSKLQFQCSWVCAESFGSRQLLLGLHAIVLQLFHVSQQLTLNTPAAQLLHHRLGYMITGSIPNLWVKKLAPVYFYDTTAFYVDRFCCNSAGLCLRLFTYSTETLRLGTTLHAMGQFSPSLTFDNISVPEF